MRLLAACVPLLVPLAADLVAQPNGNEPARVRMARAIKVVPVPHLTGVRELPVPLPFGTMIDAAPGMEDSPSLLQPEKRTEVRRIGDLAAILRDLTPLSWSDGNCTADLVGDALILTGSPDQIHLMEQSLQKLAACLGEPFRLRAAAFSVEQSADTPSVASSYDALRARLVELGAQFAWEATTSAAPGQEVELGVRRTNQYVRDVEVEIAQSSTMPNPIVSPMHLGSAVHVQAHALAGSSDVVLLAQFARGEVAAPLRDIPLGKDTSLPRLESPTVAVDFGCFSGRVQNGGALAVLMEGTWAGRRFGLVVGVDRTPVPPQAERDLGVFPLGAFLDGALRRRFDMRLHAEGQGDLWSVPLVPAEPEANQVDPAEPQTWSTLLNHALGDEQSSVNIDDGVVYVRGSAAAKQTVGRLIEQLQDQFLRTVEVECRLEAQLDRQAMVAHRLRFPALFGRQHAVVHGVETTSVYDCETEVAQKAGISDPKVIRQFSGTECCVRPFALSAQELGVTAALRVVDTVPTRTYVPENKLGTPIEEPTITRTRHQHSGRVASDGTPLDFGAGPTLTIDQRSVATRQTLAFKGR